MNKQIKKTIRLVLGWVFLGLGVVGLFLPILQGILFLGIGFILLAPDVPLFKKGLAWIKKNYPRVYKKIPKKKIKKKVGSDPELD